MQIRQWCHQKLEETGKDPPLEPSKEAWPCWHLNFRLLASRTVREQIFVVWSYQAGSNLLRRPRETNASCTCRWSLVLTTMLRGGYSHSWLTGERRRIPSSECHSSRHGQEQESKSHRFPAQSKTIPNKGKKNPAMQQGAWMEYSLEMGAL